MNTADQRMGWARFWRKLLRLTRGRVTILRALEVILEEESDPQRRECAAAIRLSLEEGNSLADAIKSRPAVFPPSVVELVSTAEKTGAWDEILQEIADGIEDGTFG